MSLNIIDLIKGQLGPALISQVAGKFGESESGISKAIAGLLPSILGGLADQSDKPSILGAITNPSTQGILGNLMGASSDNPMISGILSSLFGDKLNSVISSVSSFSGVSTTTTNSLMGIVTGATVGSIGKYAADNKLDQSGISNLLSSQKSSISSLLPSGFSLPSLGLGGLGAAAAGVVGGLAGGLSDGVGSIKEGISGGVGSVKDGISGGVDAVSGGISSMTDKIKTEMPKVDLKAPSMSGMTGGDNGGGGSSIWKWLLPLVLLLAAAYFIWKSCNKNKTESTATATAVLSDSTNMSGDSANMSGDSASTSSMSTDASGTLTAASTMVKLPSGVELNAKKGGIEEQLVAFIGSDAYKNATPESLKQKWFNFDNLNFEFGTTVLTKESKVQLDNIVAILKEYKDLKIKVGAYTDKKGSDAGNKALSQKRADAVKAALTAAGVGAQVTGAEGYGESMATVDENASDKEREADRKTAIRIEK